jgi:hypothetical protein
MYFGPVAACYRKIKGLQVSKDLAIVDAFSSLTSKLKEACIMEESDFGVDTYPN